MRINVCSTGVPCAVAVDALVGAAEVCVDDDSIRLVLERSVEKLVDVVVLGIIVVDVDVILVEELVKQSLQLHNATPAEYATIGHGQYSNALEAIVATESAMTIEVRLVQLKNAWELISVTVLGIDTDGRELHWLNVLDGITESVFDSVTIVSAVHPANALAPITCVEFGITMELRFAQFWKALPSIVVTDVGIRIACRAGHDRNSPLLMVEIVFGI